MPVSKLAWYAADPEEFRRYGGGTRHAAAARAGEKAHQTLARPRQSGRRLATALVIAAIIAVGIVTLLRV